MGLTRPRAAQIFDLDYKQATRVITVANVTLTGGAPAVVDGVSLVLNDRVLVTGQTTASQNGLYDVTVVGVGSDGTWARTSDGNATGEILAGMIVMVTEGAIYADTQWKLTTDNPIIIGTTGLTFVINILSSVGGANTQVQVNDGGTLAGFSNFVFDKTSNILSVTGNISGNYFLGNGSQLSGIITTVDANTLIGNTLSSNIVNSSLTSVGTLGSLSVTGNTTSGNLLTGGLISATGNITGGNITGGNLTTTGLITATGNVTGGNIVTAGLVTATGNVTGNFFLGNGSLLTGISASSANINNGTSNVTVVSSGGNVTVGIGGYSNVAVFGVNTLSLGGPFATPKTINANVSVSTNVNAVLVSPVIVDSLSNIFVPESSTLTIFTPI